MLNSKTLTIVATVLLLTGCAGQPTGDTRHFRFESDEADLKEPLRQRLEERGIWYKDVGEEGFIIRKLDWQLVSNLEDEVVQSVRPVSRTGTYIGYLQEIFVERLRREGIPFKRACIQGTEWIIWPRDYSGRVKQISTDITSLNLPPDALTSGRVECVAGKPVSD